jgi:poly(A) polymerase Pap1
MDLLFARLNLERLDLDLDMQELDLRTLAPECVRSVNGRSSRVPPLLPHHSVCCLVLWLFWPTPFA